MAALDVGLPHATEEGHEQDDKAGLGCDAPLRLKLCSALLRTAGDAFIGTDSKHA